MLKRFFMRSYCMENTNTPLKSDEIIFRMSFRTKTGKIIRSKTGRPFPIRIK